MNHFLHQSLTVFVTPSIYTLVKDFVPIFFIKKDQAYKHTRYATLVLTERERERDRDWSVPTQEISQFKTHSFIIQTLSFQMYRKKM